MSFSSECKNELAQIKIKQPDNALAALSAFVISAGSLRLGREPQLLLNNENMAVMRWAMQLIESLYAVDVQMLMRESAKLGGMRNYTLIARGKWLRPLLQDCGVVDEEGGLLVEQGIPPLLLKTPDRVAHALRGAFLALGTVNDPAKSYHLEMVIHQGGQAEGLKELMDKVNISAKVTSRKGNHVVYLKESEKIVAFLGLIGAHNAVLRMEDVWVYKDLRNTLNRQVNCETANLQKTASASVRQISNIKRLMAHDAFDSLSPALKEMARLRLQYPDATLTELGELAQPSVGKSGVNHRLRKLDEMAEGLCK